MTSLSKTSPWAIAPANVGELMQYAKLLADSELVPKDYRNKPGNIVVAIQMGSDVGLSPMQSLSSISVINGRATMYGDALMAVCQSHPDIEDVIETTSDTKATCTVKRRARQPVVREFTSEDAKKAGLWGKTGPWQQYPKRMLQMRARSFALRDACADILRGISSAEEQQDVIDVVSEVAQPSAKRLQAPSPAPVPAVIVDQPPEVITPNFTWAYSPRAAGPDGKGARSEKHAGHDIRDRTLVPDDTLATYHKRLVGWSQSKAESAPLALPYLEACEIEMRAREEDALEAAGESSVDSGETVDEETGEVLAHPPDTF